MAINKYYDGLTCFCTVPGAQLNNNLMEAELKLVVRDRKNAMFYKTLSGASIGDVITSVIVTASWASRNIIDINTYTGLHVSKYACFIDM